MPLTEQDITKMTEAVDSFRASNEKMLAEVAKYGTASGETKATVERMHTVLDELEGKINLKLDAESAALKARQDALDTKFQELEAGVARRGRSQENPEGDQKSKAAEKKRVFMKALRSGVDSKQIYQAEILDAEEKKTLEGLFNEYKVLQVGSDIAGGYLAPGEYVAEILKDVVEYSPIRSLCKVRTTSRVSVSFPKRTQTAAASWVSEMGSRTELQNPAFGMETIPTHEMYAMTKVTKQELEDSIFDLEAFLRTEFAEQFALTEAIAFIAGNAVGKPEGILVNPDVSYTPVGVAAALAADGLIGMYYDLKDVYLNNATWILSRPSLKLIRTLKDGIGNYLWAPGIRNEARPAEILGRPYVVAPDMPSVAADAFPVAFGDFKRGYLIVDRLVMEMMLDPYSSKSTGQVEFTARRRVGGQVIIPEAIRKLKIAVT